MVIFYIPDEKQDSQILNHVYVVLSKMQTNATISYFICKYDNNIQQHLFLDDIQYQHH